MSEPYDNSGPTATRSFADMLRVLVEGGVEFVICGGVACIMHGVSRSTVDVDIAVRMSDENLQRLIDVARRLGMQPRIPEPLDALRDPRRREEWITQKNATVYTLVSPVHPRQIDVFLKYPITFDDLKARANVMVGDDVRLLVSSKPDLIAAKRVADRETDRRDILDLEKLLQDEQSGSSTT